MHTESDDLPVAFLGNKSDLSDKRDVIQSEIDKLKDDTGFPYYECSAKTGANINKAFMDMAKKIKDNFGTKLV